MNPVSGYVAFTAGLVSFLSPCVIALVPAYVGMLTGSLTSRGEARDGSTVNALIQSAAFVSGFALLFVLMGLSVTWLGQLLAEYRWVLQRLAGMFIVVFGLHMSRIVEIPLFYREKKWQYHGKSIGARASFLMGVSFAAGWTPCVGSVLGSILFMASIQGALWQGAWLLLLYSLGLGLPFIVTALLIDRLMIPLRRFQRYSSLVQRAAGLVLILMGIVVFFDLLPALTEWM